MVLALVIGEQKNVSREQHRRNAAGEQKIRPAVVLQAVKAHIPAEWEDAQATAKLEQSAECPQTARSEHRNGA